MRRSQKPPVDRFKSNLGYQWTRIFSVSLGYRYMDVDYKKDDFIYNVVQQGVMLGLGWQF